ncbi:methyltransferase domain-containing protein [Methylobacterium sp. BTF04]|uniref:class I SAM-dependent methyltransferase n=1 Tax=Methylobacterium sp. BTF04 TaxID=2708300 RepID=UPI0013D333FB|nr:methyltransferase domain-containing protein [Methylobacterium sp. BTF04]NEU14900.1 methyltransferase domain-containing protein [Methylobacterium sp. BTF04]
MIFTHEYISNLLDSLELPFPDKGENVIRNYHRLFVQRYVNTLNEIADLPRSTRALELAANPYGMTAAIVVNLFDELSLASFGKLGEHSTLDISVGNKSFSLREDNFNVEFDRWPYEDESFDLIISCEMIEHLAMDPMHVFFEANRVLRHGGIFFVSTPNACSLQSAVKALKFQTPSMAPQYRGPPDLSGVYQRHNRELTPPALAEMFRAGGFQKVSYRTVDNYPFYNYEADAISVEVLRAIYGTHWRGDTLNFSGWKAGPPLERYPGAEDLYIVSDPRL